MNTDITKKSLEIVFDKLLMCKRGFQKIAYFLLSNFIIHIIVNYYLLYLSVIALNTTCHWNWRSLGAYLKND